MNWSYQPSNTDPNFFGTPIDFLPLSIPFEAYF